ncbi:MAG: general stress protein [Clostridia bacterium]|nr:general stress protein [Clostridia bacterium]
MAKTVIGVFRSKNQAEKAVEALRNKGFSDQEISVVAKKGDAKDDRNASLTNQNVVDGTSWGAGIGGAAGLLASAGALAIPGIGPLLALGPLAATLGGAAAGGLAGGLVDYGIPESEGREYENRVKQGDILVVISTDKQAKQAAQILREHGAEDVREH